VEDQIQKDAERKADVFSALSNPKRLLILRVLAEGKLSVGDIAKAVGTSIQNASHHLRLMSGKGILCRQRKGQSIFYQIAEPDVVAMCLKMFPDPSEDRDASD
jgi:DNA-binding transcriptional ArsR family regulator